MIECHLHISYGWYPILIGQYGIGGSQLICPTQGMTTVLGSLGICGLRMLRSVGSEGVIAIVFGIMFSIFLQAERLLRRGSKGSRILRF